MSENKAKALKNDIKVELVVGGCLNGNTPTVIDITDQLDFKDAVLGPPSARVSFGGVYGYRQINYVNGKETVGKTAHLYTDYDLQDFVEDICGILEASIVNANQLKAVMKLVYDNFDNRRRDKQYQVNSIQDGNNSMV